MEWKSWAWILGPTVLIAIIVFIIYKIRRRKKKPKTTVGGTSPASTKKTIDWGKIKGHVTKVVKHPEFSKALPYILILVALIVIYFVVPDAKPTVTETSTETSVIKTKVGNTTKEMKNAITEHMEKIAASITSHVESTTLNLGPTESKEFFVGAGDSLSYQHLSNEPYMVYARYADGEVDSSTWSPNAAYTAFNSHKDGLFTWKAVHTRAKVSVTIYHNQ